MSEIHYNPPDIGTEDGLLQEFIEIYNAGDDVVDLRGYRFDNGISYTFAEGVTILPTQYIVIAKQPSHRVWRNSAFRIFGPYDGRLDDGGERVTLRNASGEIVDTIDYLDEPPWPRGPDGYGGSLERIAFDVPTDNFHSWRTSLVAGGTPGAPNSVWGEPAYPALVEYSITPPNPTSSDEVLIQTRFDFPDEIQSVRLRYELAGPDAASMQLAMTLADQTPQSVTYQTRLPEASSQTIVRANVEVTRRDGRAVLLPHTAEPEPFLSYFVYDGEIESALPVLWILPQVSSSLLPDRRAVSAAVCLPLDASSPVLFDGAILIPSSSNREKIRFIKGHEFFGDRTINLIPEIPTGGTNSGTDSPYREHLGLWFYRQMGVLSPWAEFYRTVELPVNEQSIQRQQLVFQQVNERFLEMNGRDPDADLYKLDRRANPNWEKHTNLIEGNASIDELLDALHARDAAQRRVAIETRLNLDNMLAYSAASIFTSNWDGYWQNNWMYLDPVSNRWEMYPWDLDWIWGATPPPNTGPMYWEMPLSFPIDGVAVGDPRVSRNPGPVTSILHRDEMFYEAYIERLGRTFHTVFTRDLLVGKIESDKDRLLIDLDMIAQQTGRNVDGRKRDVQSSYETIVQYIDRRRAFLEPLLPSDIEEWALY